VGLSLVLLLSRWTVGRKVFMNSCLRLGLLSSMGLDFFSDWRSRT